MKLISVALCTLSVAHAGGHGVYSFEQECRTGKCPLTTGPATCVAVGHTGQGSTCLLTAAHCVESSANLFFAVGKTGSRYAAKVVYRNERLDIAALLVHEKLSLAPVRLTVPSPGDMVFLSGLLSRRLEESAGYLDRVDNEGRIWCRNVWSHSGMSGGAMTDEDGRLFAIHNAHTDRARTLSGPIKPAIQEFEKRHGRLRFAPDSLITQQGYCQPCQYRSRSVTRSYCPAPQTPSPSAPVTVSVSVNYKGSSKQFFAQYGNEREASISREDLNQLAAVIVSRYGERLRGERGEPGKDGGRGEDGPKGDPGPRGLIGVPDDEDIRNWLIGATADPEAKKALAAILADIAAVDPRVDELLKRLDALEKRPSVEFEETPQRVLIVDGNTKTVLDDETFSPGEPIVLDIRKLTESAK